jgi:hypothetical protein
MGQANHRHLLMAWTKNVRKSDFNRLDLSNPANRGWTPPLQAQLSRSHPLVGQKQPEAGAQMWLLQGSCFSTKNTFRSGELYIKKPFSPDG